MINQKVIKAEQVSINSYEYVIITNLSQKTRREDIHYHKTKQF